MSKSKQLLIGRNAEYKRNLWVSLQSLKNNRTIFDMKAEIKNFNDQNNNVIGGP